MFESFVKFIVHKFIPEGHLFDAVSFFIYDVIKISLLMIVIILVVSIVRTYLPPAKIKKILSHKNSILGNISASLLGIVTPFCTCSAIPLFLGFLEAGVPLGVTFSFLVASPMINEIAIVLLLGTFGWKIALLYVASGLFIAIISGLIIGKMNVENLINEDFATRKISDSIVYKSFKERAIYAKEYAFGIYKKVLPYLLIGIGLGAFMHGYVPADFLSKYIGEGNWFAVPLAVLFGVPLYSNAAGVIPLISVLTEKGVAIGTSLAFMMAVVGLSLPEFMILRRIMKPKLIIIFASIVAIGIILIGYLFNAII
jgi:uncharacterized membrane protein YraQ (UPF0718 family)